MIHKCFGNSFKSFGSSFKSLGFHNKLLCLSTFLTKDWHRKTMSFSKEDKKKVFDFFVACLKKYDEPVYYEKLRGYVSGAEPVVRKYVYKECKGENLRNFFKTRKNYFSVNFKDEVILLKNKEVDTATAKSDTTVPDDLSYEELTRRDYFDSSRSNSVSSRHRSRSSSIDDIPFDVKNKLKSDSENVAVQYFFEFLTKNEKLNLNTIEINCLPRNIRVYINKDLNKNIMLLFKNHPEIFHIDNENFVLLKSKLEVHDEFSTETGEETRTDVIKSLSNFIDCAEFFSDVLKRKSLPLSYISGHLSRASLDVSVYLKSKYKTFKEFLQEADKLFVFNNDEVAVTKNGASLLKKAKTLLYAESNSNLSPKALKQEIYSYLKSDVSTKHDSLSSLSEKDEINDFASTDAKQCEESTEVIEDINKQEKSEIHYMADEKNFNIGINSDVNSEKLSKTKNKKAKAEKCNIFADENINDSSLERNKTLDDKFKYESKPSKSVVHVKKENFIETELQDEAFETSVDSKKSIFSKTKSNTVRNFIESVFTIHLLCLEVVQQEFTLRLKYEYDAVKFFVETLEKHPLKMSDITCLKGSLGQASKDVNFFMRKFYKGDKIEQFFKKHKEFDLRSQSGILILSVSYMSELEEKKKLHENFVDGTLAYNVYNLFNVYLHDIFIDTLDCLSKICDFLQNKSRLKLSRLNNVFPRLSVSQKTFIDSLSGNEFHEKLERFLCYFSIFKSDEEYIEFESDLNLDISLFINLISEFIAKHKKLHKDNKSEFQHFDYLLDNVLAYKNEYSVMNREEVNDSIIQGIQSCLSCLPNLPYSDLPNVLGYEILHNLILEKKNSQFLIKLVEESNLFSLKDGKISHKNVDDEAIDFIQDSSTSNGSQESEETSDIENAEELSEKDDLVFFDYSKKPLTIIPSFDRNDKCLNGNVNEISQENLEVTVSTACSIFDNGKCVNTDESKTENSKLMSDNSEEISSTRNEPSDQQQNEQNDLNCKSNSIAITVSKPFALNDIKADNESKECNLSDISVSKQSVLNLETDNSVSCSAILNERDVESVVESSDNSDEVVKLAQNFVDDSNEGNCIDSTNLKNKHKSMSSIEDSSNNLAREYSKHSPNDAIMGSKIRENQNKIISNVAASFSGSVGLEVSNTEIDCNISNTDVNCVRNILSTENINQERNIKSLSSASTCSSTHSSHKPDSGDKKYRNDSLLESSVPSTSSNIKSIPTSDAESRKNSNITSQNKITKTEKESFAAHPTGDGSPELEKDSGENDLKGDKLQQHDFDSVSPQLLHGKIILLTLDSCIVEAVINGRKKCIFCLKSCFHCDLHTCCSDCFNSLAIGDKMLCYVPNIEDLNCGNMCFAFKFHKELKADCQINNSEKQIKCTSSGNDETASNISQNTLVQSSGVCQSTQAQPVVTSQSTQTIKLSSKECHSLNKKCQVEWTTVSNFTQTSSEVTSEIECQTVLAGDVKLCVEVCEKACLTNIPTVSQKTQTACEKFEHSSQTNISGNIKPQYEASSCESQTTLSGSSYTDSCSQTDNLYIDETIQPKVRNVPGMTRSLSTSFEKTPLTHVNIPCAANTGAISKHSSPAQKMFCDIATQTFSTGHIMSRQIYQD